VTTPVQSYPHIGLPLLGVHQGRNLATALGVLDCLRERGWRIERPPLVETLSTIRIPGRLELISATPPILLDVAHNADSTHALALTLEDSRFSRLEKVLIFGSSRDKDFRTQLQILESRFETIIITQTSSRERSCAPEEIVKLCGWEHRSNVIVCPSTTRAWEQAVSLAGREKLLVISGSFYLTGEMRGIARACEKNRQSPLRVTA
jgi:dihydrofolate synthase/folylpolyglutamate synthase